MQVTTIGLDLAKNVFQVHGVDQCGKVALRKQLCRDQVVSIKVAGAYLRIRAAVDEVLLGTILSALRQSR